MKFVGHIKDIVNVRCAEFGCNILKNKENSPIVSMVTIRYIHLYYLFLFYIQCAACFIKLASKLQDF